MITCNGFRCLGRHRAFHREFLTGRNDNKISRTTKTFLYPPSSFSCPPQTTTVEFPPRIGARDHQPDNQNQQRLWVPPKVNDIWLNVDDTRSVDLKRGAECPGVYILA
jgi:hypothetical protein